MKIYFLIFLFSGALFGRDLTSCQTKSLHKGHSIPFDTNKNFIPECAPKVLYSWQSYKRVEKWMKESHPKNVLPLKKNNYGDSALFLWIDPIGTFAYGDTPIKFTLKEGAKFKYIGDNRFVCKKRTPFFNDKKVYVRYFQTGFGQQASEYIICDATAIKKWEIYGP